MQQEKLRANERDMKDKCKHPWPETIVDLLTSTCYAGSTFCHLSAKAKTMLCALLLCHRWYCC